MSKDKGGRQAKKPKQEQNIKTKGQTPGPTAVGVINSGKSGR